MGTFVIRSPKNKLWAVVITHGVCIAWTSAWRPFNTVWTYILYNVIYFTENRNPFTTAQQLIWLWHSPKSIIRAFPSAWKSALKELKGRNQLCEIDSPWNTKAATLLKYKHIYACEAFCNATCTFLSLIKLYDSMILGQKHNFVLDVAVLPFKISFSCMSEFVGK